MNARLNTIVKWASGTLTAITMIGLLLVAGTMGRAGINERAELDASIQREIEKQTQQIQAQEFLENQECLALNIYHEARSESNLGKRAVAWVTLNRVQHTAYPNAVCDVVYQARLDSHGNPRRNQCQFSWYCDGKSDRITNQEEWNRSLAIAALVMQNYGKIPDPTDGAIMYHAVYVNPDWVRAYNRTVRIDTHVFYAQN